MDALWSRRLVLGALLATPPWLQAGAAETPYTLQRRALRFPADHGSHPDSRTEWWYMTGWLRDAQDRLLGFQITFFRTRPDLDTANPSIAGFSHDDTEPSNTARTATV